MRVSSQPLPACLPSVAPAVRLRSHSLIEACVFVAEADIFRRCGWKFTMTPPHLCVTPSCQATIHHHVPLEALQSDVFYLLCRIGLLFIPIHWQDGGILVHHILELPNFYSSSQVRNGITTDDSKNMPRKNLTKSYSTLLML